ncbi:hypothetical protein ES703_78115 [subsurface metagenome]
MDSNLNEVIALLADGQQPDGKAQLFGVLKVAAVQAGNALAVDILGTHLMVESQRSQYGQLISRIYALDIVLRVCLGVAQLLGAFQCRGEVNALPGHAGEDIVGGAVDDGVDTAYLVSHQVLLEGGDEGNAAADAGFVVQADALFLSQGEKLHAVLGDKLFIGANHVFARLQRALMVVQRRFFAADSLDHDIYIFIEKLVVIGGKKL